MSRPIPVNPCNRRFNEGAPVSEVIANASRGRRTQAETDQPDVISWDSSLLCPGEPLDIRRLDEASVDACFSKLSDLLADIS